MIETLLLEDDPRACAALQAAARDSGEVTITAVTGSAIQARRLAQKHNFDAMIVDLELTEGDGVSFVLELSAFYPAQKPLILVTTRTTAEPVLDALRAQGAYVMMKTNSSYTPQFILQMISRCAPYVRPHVSAPPEDAPQLTTGEARRQNVLDSVGRLIQYFGGSPGLDGYDLLIATTQAFLEREHGFPSLSKEVYPALQARFGKKPKNIEHAMRYIIDEMWSTHPDRMAQYHVPRNAKTERCGIRDFCAFLANRFRREYHG